MFAPTSELDTPNGAYIQNDHCRYDSNEHPSGAFLDPFTLVRIYEHEVEPAEREKAYFVDAHEYVVNCVLIGPENHLVACDRHSAHHHQAVLD